MSSSKKKVLIVEDEKSLCKALGEELHAESFLVAVARDGEEGLERFAEFSPDIILLDLMMPKMSGTEMLEELRKDIRGADIPVIIITNFPMTSEDRIASVVKHKPNFYLIKTDWKIKDIILKVKEVLG